MLGDAGRSFVVGYGHNPPTRVHHRAASCPAPPLPCNFSSLHTPLPNPNTLLGALVGGPLINDSFRDNRTDYAKSEVDSPSALSTLLRQGGSLCWQQDRLIGDK